MLLTVHLWAMFIASNVASTSPKFVRVDRKSYLNNFKQLHEQCTQSHGNTKTSINSMPPRRLLSPYLPFNIQIQGLFHYNSHCLDKSQYISQYCQSECIETRLQIHAYVCVQLQYSGSIIQLGTSQRSFCKPIVKSLSLLFSLVIRTYKAHFLGLLLKANSIAYVCQCSNTLFTFT